MFIEAKHYFQDRKFKCKYLRNTQGFLFDWFLVLVLTFSCIYMSQITLSSSLFSQIIYAN